MTGWLRYFDPFTSKTGHETIGVFASHKAAMSLEGNGEAIPFEGIEAHCRLREKGGVYFTRIDQSFGQLFGALVDADVVSM